DLRESPEAARTELTAVHDASYLDRLEAVAARGGGSLDPDTVMNGDSWRAALRSAGGAVAAVEWSLANRAPAFSAGRPPGHHALRAQAMGFCLLAGACIASRAGLRLG